MLYKYCLIYDWSFSDCSHSRRTCLGASYNLDSKLWRSPYPPHSDKILQWFCNLLISILGQNCTNSELLVHLTDIPHPLFLASLASYAYTSCPLTELTLHCSPPFPICYGLCWHNTAHIPPYYITPAKALCCLVGTPPLPI